MSSSAPSPDVLHDPRPQPPKEPQLEDCCGTGCVHCVFDMYQIALEHYATALAAWQARHSGQADGAAAGQRSTGAA
jgi:hypothetical protein